MSLTWSQLTNKLIEKAAKKRVPITGQFELTARCNLRCKMCYVSKPSNDKNAIKLEHSANDWIHLAEEAHSCGMLYLLLTGGEVFLLKDFKTIYENIASMGFNIDIYSNATLINKEVINWLKHTPPSVVSVTLYGGSPETYARVTGNPENFKKAAQGIDLLISEGITTEIKTTITNKNVSDFAKMAEFAEKRGLRLGVINYISPRRDRFNNSPQEERLSPQKLAQIESYISNYYRKKQEENAEKFQNKLLNEVSLNYNITPDKVIDTANCKPQNPNTSEPFYCGSSKYSFWVTWDGRMTPCSLMDIPYSLPFKNGFAPAWDKLQKLSSTIPINTKCNNCSEKEYCQPCPAKLKNETGSYDKPAPYLCELARQRKILNNIYLL